MHYCAAVCLRKLRADEMFTLAAVRRIVGVKVHLEQRLKAQQQRTKEQVEEQILLKCARVEMHC